MPVLRLGGVPPLHRRQECLDAALRGQPIHKSIALRGGSLQLRFKGLLGDTPAIFYRSGDCEDYAIAKFLSLRALGWPKEALRFVGVGDTARGTQHAIIVARLNGDDWVMDNQYEDVVSASTLDHYRLLWSLSENQSWRVAKTRNSPASAENQDQPNPVATASNARPGLARKQR